MTHRRAKAARPRIAPLLMLLLSAAQLSCGSDGSNAADPPPPVPPPTVPEPTPSPVVGTNALTRVPSGLWGGRGIELQITDSGATVQLDCAHGTIPQPLLLDTAGQFHVTGTLVLEGGPRPAPTLAPVPLPSPSPTATAAPFPSPIVTAAPGTERPAQYTGQLNGATMQLTVRYAGPDREVVTSYTLNQNQAGQVSRCY